MIKQLIGALCLAIGLSAQVSGQVLIMDDFNVDTSANYTILDDGNAPSGDGEADSTVTFASDYSALGVPSAPNSGGTTSGLVMTVNDTPGDNGGVSNAQEDHVTAFHNTAINAPAYELMVDVYFGVDLGSGGSTEFGHVGVASDGSDFNSIFTPIAGEGHYVSITGEGGSSSDYRHSTPSQPAVPTGDSTYLNPENSTNASVQFYQDLFPNSDVPGSPTNIWTTLSITVTPTLITYRLDDVPFIRTPTEVSSGLVSLGYTDPFDSVGPHFIVYDNLKVSVIPEPTAGLLAAMSACFAWCAGRRVR